MPKELVKKGILNYSTDIFIQNSAQTDGRGLTGLTFETSNLICYYRRTGATPVVIPLVTQTVTGAHTDGGFVEISDTLMKGQYRLDLPDTALASGVNKVTVHLSNAANMAPCLLEIQLTDLDVNDSVRAGLTSLPNANAEAAGGMYTRGSGAGQVNQNTNGQIDSRSVALSDNVITSDSINNGAFVTAKFASDFLTNALIADNAFASEQFASNFLTNSKIADNALSNSKFADAFLTAVKIGADAFTNAKFADNVFSAEQFAADFLTNSKIADNAFNSEQFVDAFLTNAKIADNTFSSAKFVNAFLTSSLIATAAITAGKYDGTTVYAQTGDNFNRIGTPNDTDIATDILNVQNSVNNIGSASGGAIHFALTGDNTSAPIKGVSFVGSQVGTYQNLQAQDGTEHQINHSGDAFDIVYRSNVGGNYQGVELTWHGRVNGSNDTASIQVYDFIGTDWETIYTIQGITGTLNTSPPLKLLQKHTGTGSDLGDVLIRIVTTGQTAPTLYSEQLIVAAVNASQSIGYANGAIWVNENGEAGAVAFLNGTADNPCPWANAVTLSNDPSVGLKKFAIANGTTVTLAASAQEYTLIGKNWVLELGNQSVQDAHFEGAKVTGICTGTNYTFEDCKIDFGGGGDFTASYGDFNNCKLSGDLTFTGAGTYGFDKCSSRIAGTGTPSINFGVGVGSTNVNFRHYSGGIEILNMGQSGTDKMSLEGDGQYILNANCTGGELEVRGSFRKTDNTAGAVTINEEANIKTDTIHDGYVRASTSNTIQLATSASSVNGNYDPAEIFIVKGTGKGQSRRILEYVGSTRIAIVNRNWKVNPDTTSEYRVIADSGFLSVNEGLAQGGSTDTITLNALASSSNNVYRNQFVFIVSGTGDDQVGRVKSYNGTSKIATMSQDWTTTPDVTSAYIMIPQACAEVQAIAGQDLGDSVGANFNTFHNNGDSSTSKIVDDMATEGADGDTLKTLSDQIDGISAGASPSVLCDAEIDTVTDQTHIILANETDVSNKDNAYLDQAIVLYENANNDRTSTRKVAAYAGDSRTVTLDSAPDFTLTTADSVKIFVTAPGTTAPTSAQNRIEMDTNSTKLTDILADTNETQGKLPSGSIPSATENTADMDANSTKLISIIEDTNEIQGKLPSGNISDLALTDQIDGQSLNFVLELIQASISGRYKKDDPTANHLSFYKQNNTTKIATVLIADLERTRTLP